MDVCFGMFSVVGKSDMWMNMIFVVVDESDICWMC